MVQGSVFTSSRTKRKSSGFVTVEEGPVRHRRHHRAISVQSPIVYLFDTYKNGAGHILHSAVFVELVQPHLRPIVTKEFRESTVDS